MHDYFLRSNYARAQEFGPVVEALGERSAGVWTLGATARQLGLLERDDPNATTQPSARPIRASWALPGLVRFLLVRR